LSQHYSVDCAILGGGISGLWLLNRLSLEGYNCVLLESHALGSGQTIASQGMIHGGIKYTLGGALTGASESIADMPDLWRACLKGQGQVDLRSAKILSDHFYLWSTSGAKSQFGGFLASKLTQGRVEKVAAAERPDLFQTEQFHGTLYRLIDMVIDTASVLEALADNYPDRIYSINKQKCHWQPCDDGQSLRIGDIHLKAKAFVFTAGTGNENLLKAVGAVSPQTQRRPLQQVMVKHRSRQTFYGHCAAMDKTPRLTISSHPADGDYQVWYLGGALAENGADQNEEDLTALARQELHELMPWFNFVDPQWATLKIDRAEPRQRGLVRPDGAHASWAEGSNCDNIIAAWPTKLTLAPNVSTLVLNLLKAKNIVPSDAPQTPLPFGRAQISATPWSRAFDAHSS